MMVIECFGSFSGCRDSFEKAEYSMSTSYFDFKNLFSIHAKLAIELNFYVVKSGLSYFIWYFVNLINELIYYFQNKSNSPSGDIEFKIKDVFFALSFEK